MSVLAFVAAVVAIAMAASICHGQIWSAVAAADQAIVRDEGERRSGRGSPERTPAALRAATRAFERAAECRACAGAGQVQRRRLIGWRSLSGGVKVPVHADYSDACAPCGGVGIAPTERVLALLGRVHHEMEQLMRADSADQAAPPLNAAGRAAVADTTRVLRDFAVRYIEALGPRLAADAGHRLASATISTGAMSEVARSDRANRSVGRDPVVAFIVSQDDGPIDTGAFALGDHLLRIRDDLQSPSGRQAAGGTGDDGADSAPHRRRSDGQGGVLVVARLWRSVSTERGVVHELESAVIVTLPPPRGDRRR